MRLLLSSEHAQFITDELVSQPPERLLHVVGREILPGTFDVTGLVLDHDAEASGAHCRPSVAAEEELQAWERATGDHYIGIVHSHPPDVPEPSSQDARAAGDTLEKNPHMPAALVGVVTDTRPSQLPDHRLGLGRGQLSIHFADRSRPGGMTPGTAVVGDTAAFVRSLGERMPAASLAAMMGRRVAVFGAGSLGSTVAEVLTRNGVGALHLVDHDVVEAVNLSRSTYTTLDLGRHKAEALADRLLAINPLLQVTSSTERLSDDTVDHLLDVVAWADLVLAVTDDPRAQAMTDHLLQRCDKPGLFAGVLPGGHIGELLLVIPGVTTCYRCAAGQHRLTASRTSMDYSTGRQKGAVALGADVTTIAAITGTTALRLLGLQHGADQALAIPLRAGRSMVQIGLAPEAFTTYPTFRRTPNQHMFQTVWIQPEPREDCPDCLGLDVRDYDSLAGRIGRLRAWGRSIRDHARKEAASASPTHDEQRDTKDASSL